MSFQEINSESRELSNIRLRFLVLNKRPDNHDLSRLEKAGVHFYSDSFFYELDFSKESSKIMLPIVGSKKPSRALVQDFLKTGIELENLELRFNELQSFIWLPENKDNAPSDDEILAQIASIYDTVPSTKKKKLLVELNSKDLALHFFV